MSRLHTGVRRIRLLCNVTRREAILRRAITLDVCESRLAAREIDFGFIDILPWTSVNRELKRARSLKRGSHYITVRKLDEPQDRVAGGSQFLVLQCFTKTEADFSTCAATAQ